MGKVLALLINHVQETVEFMKATGIVDDALAQKWIEMSDYVPFYRQAEGGRSLTQLQKVGQA